MNSSHIDFDIIVIGGGPVGTTAASLLSEKGFADQNRVLGFSYDYNSSLGFWFKPFLGLHQQPDVGSNGYMAGWVFGYDFSVKERIA